MEYLMYLMEINTLSPAMKWGFPFDQTVDCRFPTWDPFESVCLWRDSQRPESRTSCTHKGDEDSKYRTVINRRDTSFAGWITWNSCVC